MMRRSPSARWLGVLACFSLSASQAAAQSSQPTARLERLFFVEIASLLCEMELTDETEDALDQAISVEQRRLRLTDRQMAAIYEQVRASVAANQEAACESVRLLDPSPGDADD